MNSPTKGIIDGNVKEVKVEKQKENKQFGIR